jgi:hypothetical protein
MSATSPRRLVAALHEAGEDAMLGVTRDGRVEQRPKQRAALVQRGDERLQVAVDLPHAAGLRRGGVQSRGVDAPGRIDAVGH